MELEVDPSFVQMANFYKNHYKFFDSSSLYQD